MRLLLDTHVFLWFVLNDAKLTLKAKILIEDPSNDILISPASYWEIAIKVSHKKLNLFATYDDFMQRGTGQGQGSDAMESPVFQFMRALIECDKPVVAAVTGAAIGIGTTMLLHCDFVYVSDEARLAMPFVGLGLVPEFASSLVVPQLMGHRRAAEKLLLGDPFTPEQAVECGIASAVLPAGEVINHARRIAERFNALPPGAVRESKQLMRGPQHEELLKTIRSEGEIFARRLRSPEAMEAFQAFFQKRKPDFSKF